MKTLYYSYLIILLLFIGNNYCFGQAQNQEVTPYTALYPFEENGLYGLMDSVGRVAIEAQFSQIFKADLSKNEVSIRKFEREISYRDSERSRENSNAREYNKRIPVKHRKSALSKSYFPSGNFLFLPYKNNAFYFLNEWAVVRIDDIYGYINYKGEIRLNANDASKAFFRNSSASKIDFNWELEAEKIRTKIELLHPNKFITIRPLKNYPHLVIVFNRRHGKYQGSGGLLKLDTLKNITETIIPINKKYIEYNFREGFLVVTDQHPTDSDNSGARRYFNLSEETFWDVAAEKIKTKIERLHPNKYEYIFPIINYPHLIIVHQKINGTRKSGLLKLDTLKNKIETIIPIKEKSIKYTNRGGFFWVEDEQGTRLFDLSKETYQDIAEEKIKSKIEQLHPNKYQSLKPLKNYPHLIIVNQFVKGVHKYGLIKLDTLKNKTETIIPINKNSIIRNDFQTDLLKVYDEQGTRFFNLSEETYSDIAEQKVKTKIERLHPNKYESLKPLKNDPHLIIASQKIKGTSKAGLIKLDTLKNKVETIIPFNKSRINNNDFLEDLGLLEVVDEQGTRLFKLSDKTFLSPVFTKLGRGLNGYIAAKVNYKWGVLDSLGNWLYPPQLDLITTFRKDLISITRNEKRLYIEENGQLTNSDFEIMGSYGLQPNLFIFHLNGKYGIINTATRDTILAPLYDDFIPQYDGYPMRLQNFGAIKITKNNKHGLVNLAGKLITPCIYTEMRRVGGSRDTNRHILKVKINNKVGLIDYEGNEILVPKYDEIKALKYGAAYAFRKGKKWGYVYLRQESPLNEKKVVSPKYTSIRPEGGKILYTTKREEKEKVLNLIPKPIIRNLKFTHQTALSETFILFRNAGEPLGIYNSQTKKIIIPPTYDSYTKLNNSHLVSLKKGQKFSVFNYRAGDIYHKNKFNSIYGPYTQTVTSTTHKSHSSYSSCIAFKIDNKWGLMNAKGEIILEAKAKNIPRLNEENLFEIKTNDHIHQVDTTGKIVLTTEIKKAPTGYGSCIPFQEGNLWGLKNAEGEIIFDAEFRYWPKLNEQNLFEIYIDGRFHLLDSVGKIVLATDFTEIIPLMTGKTEVRFRTDSNLWGIADSNYQVIFHPQFEEFKYKDNWIIQVQKQGKWYWLKPDFTLGDTDSIPKFKPNGYPNFGYDTAYPYNYNLSNPYFTVIKNDKKGLIDTLGKEIIPPEYDKIIVLHDTLAVVKKGKKYGLLNFQTNTLLQPIIFDKYERGPCFILEPKKAYINYQGEFVWKEEFFDFNEVETVLKVK